MARIIPTQTKSLTIGGRREPKYLFPTVSTSGSFSWQDGDSNSYNASTDTYVYDKVGSVGLNFSTTGTVITDYNSATDNRYGLLRFGGIESTFATPSTVTVTAASLDLNVDTEGQGFDIFNLLKTGINFSTVTATSLGTMVAGTDYTSIAMGSWPGQDTFTGAINIVLDNATVQGWIRNSSSNLGMWQMATDIPNGDGQQVSSVETVTQSHRPKLNVTYTGSGLA